VTAAADPAADRAIAGRLRSIYASVEGLGGVEVTVDSGIVHLEGEVLSAGQREQAERLARLLEGVIEVENRIQEVRDVRRRLQPQIEDLRQRLVDAVAYLPLLAVAIVVMVVFWLLAGWVGRWQRPFRHLTRSHFAQELLRRAVRAAVLVAGALLALEILDATALVGAVLGAAGIAGIALGFAFRDTAENYIASVLLSLRQPFAPNDHVVIEGWEGKVVRLTPRATILMTLDGNHVRIPNAVVFKGVLLNYTRNPRRRFELVVGVGTAVDLAAALDLGLSVLGDTEGVMAEPPADGWIERLGDSNVELRFVGWVDQRTADLVKVRSEAIRQLKTAFDAAGIDMPEPIYRVSGLPPVATPTAERPREPAAPPPPATAERDVSRDTHLDREVAADRAEAGTVDLLDPGAPQE